MFSLPARHYVNTIEKFLSDMTGGPFSLFAYVGSKLDNLKKQDNMTIEEYKAQPFKYDGECKPVPISEIWPDLPRRDRRKIERLVKNGKNPDIMRFIDKEI